MKKYFNKSMWSAAICSLIFLSACKKDGTNVIFKGGTAPVLTASVSDSIPLNPATQNNQAVVFNWTNPEYQFSNGISSLNVTYDLEFDTVGANFTSPKMQTVQVSPDLSKTFTVASLNALVGNGLQLAFGQPHQLQVRVVSVIAPYTSGSPNAGPLASNSITYTVTPFAPPPAVTPPASGTLFIIGSATAGAWNQPVPVPSQQFTQVSSTLYTITLPLIGGQAYDFIPVNGSWAEKYAVADASIAGLNQGGSFLHYVSGGKDIPGPSASGTYKVDVNFQTGLFAVTKQ